jgi:hypothetical protein
MNTFQLQVIAASMEAVAAGAAAGGQLAALQVMKARRGRKMAINCQGAIGRSLDTVLLLYALKEFHHCLVWSSS